MDLFGSIVENCKMKNGYSVIEVKKWSNCLEPVIAGYLMEAYLILNDINNKERQITLSGIGSRNKE